MTKKTRLRVARTAAGAVIAVGASLTAAGAAQAADIGADVAGVEIGVRPTAEPGHEDPGGDGDPCSPLDPRCEPPEPSATPPHPSVPPTGPARPSEPPTTPEAPPSPPAKPSATPTKAPTRSADPGDSGDSGSGVGQIGVSGGSGGTTDRTDTDSVGNQPVEQGRGKDELAETGAGGTAFLLVGAATMVAGGIGFRVLPRLTRKRTAV
ncbi:LPXTG cell wall anchor domain-containing protein [Streptomyces drozdowiczii]|uniref:LPXTG cell wall anchor domain-containing protein n=1 Tax=Streptomyces drozdowiczii TaxID=202862 RepID=A0ABY6PUP8_9ACTN|nr:LPXTG cell wall anchor domain-containing protein [Streptomyces drozdowiczii]MCX0244136.1 LPXTG cell wall anchor domain-containing protein [Streptomyces drozdowiczii]UZK56047.1 LPXTG cell wall anchor domain-containing protein [Streptomyces drozdowiczii]